MLKQKKHVNKMAENYLQSCKLRSLGGQNL